jgi:hypothetical protein
MHYIDVPGGKAGQAVEIVVNDAGKTETVVLFRHVFGSRWIAKKMRRSS